MVAILLLQLILHLHPQIFCCYCSGIWWISKAINSEVFNSLKLSSATIFSGGFVGGWTWFPTAFLPKMFIGDGVLSYQVIFLTCYNQCLNNARNKCK